MKSLRIGVVLFTILLVVVLISCGGGGGQGGGTNWYGADTYDVNTNGIPKFVSVDYIELSKIQMISKFRSSAGHDYSDDFETCRTMKHYYWPFGGSPWTEINIYSPINGTISKNFQEWAGAQIWIKSNDYPAFYIIIPHLNLSNPLNEGDMVIAGQLLGNHIGDQTMSDIMVGVNTPSGWKLLSYFDVITDFLFQSYQTRGVSSREMMIISKDARDADPLTCVRWGGYTNSGNIGNWISLN